MERLLAAVAVSVGTMIVPRNDDDIISRLNHRYTTFVFVFCAILVSTKQYVGEPINCWVPAQFTDNHEDYANKICWVSNTYYLPFRNRIPNQDSIPAKIGYYQWVPLILMLQAVGFYLPVIFWRWFGFGSGLDVNDIIYSCKSAQAISHLPEKEKTIQFVAQQIGRFLHQHRLSDYQKSDSCVKKCFNYLSKRCFCGKRYGNYISTVYIMAKFFYALNASLQIWMLNLFIGNNYHLYGIQVLKGLILNRDWDMSPVFPRVTICDFTVRQLGGNLHRHTVQCVLPINLFHEKVFIFIWFWLVFVAILSFFSFLVWTYKCSCLASGNDYIFSKLLAYEKVIKNSSTLRSSRKFLSRFLRHDGLFILRIIELNVNSLVVAEITVSLWHVYNRKPNNNLPNNLSVDV